MPPPGIEPGSSVLQTGAMTTSAKTAVVFGGNEWTRTTSSLRMKEVDYHCPTLPYINTLSRIRTALPIVESNHRLRRAYRPDT